MAVMAGPGGAANLHVIIRFLLTIDTQLGIEVL
jgi:hypothetical protein